ncbi:DNA adenine methylase [Iodobacter sp. HSC-16F04]|uniref:site-specific DNA-methyltransferase (adenine-specific) n=1 Tax=Iodobacter violaceini TaxID=3044271 RepID=A0ABX0KV29_9NEIS|nr:DNA adenine methylase [Iodobacter violacea]NHQ84871.1 DNA adenine methylase [Iodobacter violacea]
MAFYTPLRYPGGKGKLAYYVKSLIEENNLHDGHYVEPYAGGAGVAIELLMQEYVRKIHINDIDPAVHGFWHSVLYETDELCRLINDTPVNMATWHEQKAIISDTINHSLLEIGFATFFLNRTNRSGILKAGVIGGKEQSGKWKLDVRYTKKNLLERITKIAAYESRIILHNKDTADLIKNLPADLHKNALVYLDPPYYIKGQDLYRNFYCHNDHIEIMLALSQSKILNWIVSYDNAEQIREIYRDFRKIEYSLQYSAQNKTVGEEVMIFSSKIKIPEIHLGKL